MYIGILDEHKLSGNQEASEVLELFYLNAYKGLEDYFYENRYESHPYTTPHLWAMCCNNLAIAYIGTGELEKQKLQQ